jgi:hypothetical protein
MRLMLALICMGVGGAIAATGTVFDDANGNGLFDAGEVGIKGVRVSNGSDVVQTDADGRYELDLDRDGAIFVTKPAGYAVPLNEHQIPQFFYVHRPQGSPGGFRYRGLDPTGDLPAAIDFGLTRSDEPSLFRAILFADPQPQTEVELDYIRDDVVNDLIGTDARFGMTLGDIMFDDLSLFPRYNALIAQIGIPWYNVPGNHELNLEAEDDFYSLETFQRYFGPPYYSFEYGDALFVVLDNIEYRGHGESDPGDVRGSGGYVGKIGNRQLAWLKRELEFVPEDKLIFLAMHSPLANYVSPDSASSNTADRKKLFKLLQGRPNLYAVAGHTHTTEHQYFGEEDGFRGPGTLHHHVLSTVSGSWWSGPFDERGVPTTWQRDGTPNGWHELSVDGTQVTVSFVAAGAPRDYQMRILFDVAHHGLRRDGIRDYREGELFDSRIDRDQIDAAQILVNLFDGGPKSEVHYRIGDGPMMGMERVSRVDPFIGELFQRHDATKKSWVDAKPSSHLFEADLPDGLSPGTYTVSVEAVDEFGVTHHAHTVLEVR